MQTSLNAYLNFKDTSRQAMEFYHSVFGGKLELHTFKEYGAPVDAGEEDLIMHSVLTVSDAIKFMAADTPARMDYKPGANFAMSLSGDDEAQLTEYFDKLSAGGNAVQALKKEVWGDTFGMFTDKFGTRWLVNISAKK